MEKSKQPPAERFFSESSHRPSAVSLHHYRQSFEQSHDIIFFFRPDGQISEANRSAVAAYGYSYDELLTKSISDLRTEQAPDDFFAQLEQVRHWSFQFESVHRRRDGTCFPVEITWVLSQADDEQMILGVIRDITERRQAEEALRQSEERFRLTFENAASGIAHVAPDGRWLRVNQRLCEMTGYTQAELLARTFQDLTHPADLATDLEFVRRVLAGEMSRYSLEKRYLRRDGSVLWINLTVALVRDAAGAPAYFIAIIEDITARKQIELERERLRLQEQQARETAEAATRAKDQFLAVVSHELRSPLSAILGFAQMIRAHQHQAEQVVHFADIITRSARTQQRLIEDLLDTARIITGKLKLDTAPTDLRLLLTESLAVVQPAAAARRIDLSASLGDQPLTVIGDATRLQQIIWNLLQNAIKFTPEGGHVALRLERSPEQARIIVSDTGQGIAPEVLPHIFERFWQMDMSGTRRYGGLGLGLALVEDLVELHGGTIAAASAGVGQGTTFTVTLPLHAPPVVEAPPQVRAVAEMRTGPEAIPLANLPRLDGVRVLVVDDQEGTRARVAGLLSECGAAAMTAASGQEAVSLLRDHQFDVLVCDIAMPGEDGYQVLRRIRDLEAQQGTPPAGRLAAIALTAMSRSEDRLRALRAGFQTYLAKPVEPAELIVVLASLASQRGATAD